MFRYGLLRLRVNIFFFICIFICFDFFFHSYNFLSWYFPPKRAVGDYGLVTGTESKFPFSILGRMMYFSTSYITLFSEILFYPFVNAQISFPSFGHIFREPHPLVVTFHRITPHEVLYFFQHWKFSSLSAPSTDFEFIGIIVAFPLPVSSWINTSIRSSLSNYSFFPTRFSKLFVGILQRLRNIFVSFIL